MKNRSLLLATALLLLPAAGALAADDADVSGSVELGIRAVDDQDNSAKFQEYRDVDDGVFGSLNLDYFKGSYYFGVDGKNIGLDDQSYLFKGGSFGQFDYSIFYDEIPHNLSFGAKSFYSGIGTNMLTINVDPDNQAAWNSFDYSVDRKKYGAEVSASLGSPFFIDVGVSREEKDGLKPLGTGSFSGQVEMPEPVDYETDDLTIAGGFGSTEIMFKVSGMISSFDNDNKFISWTNPFTSSTEVNTLPPDNDYGKIGANLTWRNLPMMSSLLVNGSYSNISNDFSLNQLNMSAPSGLNQTTFDGDVSYATFSASLVSRPIDQLNTRLFYSYLDKENDSSIIQYAGGGNTTHIFDYSKHNLGADANYNLAMHTKLSAGYEFKDVDRRNREDAENTTDNLLFVQAKNTSMDFMTVKARYSFLDREADENHDLTGVSMIDAENIVQYVQRFDATTKQKNEIKLMLEFYPADNLDLGLEYAYVNNDYDDVTLGRTEDEGHELYADFMWRASQVLNINGFAGYEKYEADSNHYNFQAGAGTPPQLANPTADDGNPSSYRWTQSLDDDFWTVGLMGQMPLMKDRLMLSLSWQYQQSDGETEFTTEGSSALLPIEDAEDYYITFVEAKAMYAVTEKLDMILGYIYEDVEYEDLQYLGYEYQPPGSLLTGAYADHDYETHLGYLTVRYKF
ncbi:MAG TPA: MtrB/PioB family decaheme-associated outer membrane protein [Desulfobacteraceae bacterium]|nr:MtrB/PioB family decaheme-associated outer membrane protein [Desulfobacteraceae bacterium]